MDWSSRSLVVEKFPRLKRAIVCFRFLKHVTIGRVNACWEWQGKCDRYGIFTWEDEHIHLAHIAAYRLFIGHIPKKHGRRLYVCHSCDNPVCVNPNHLWLGTQKDNVHDMMNKGRKASLQGERNSNAKLTVEDIHKIKRLYRKGKYSNNAIGRRFGVTGANIGLIVKGNTWIN